MEFQTKLSAFEPKLWKPLKEEFEDTHSNKNLWSTSPRPHPCSPPHVWSWCCETGRPSRRVAGRRGVPCLFTSASEISAGVTSPRTPPPKLLKNTKGRCFLPGRRLTPFPSFVCSAAGAKGSGYQRRLEKALAAWLMGRRGLRLRRRMGDSGPGTTPAAAPYSVFNVRES